MRYPDGQEVKLGDKVKLGNDDKGVVVCSIDSNDYSSEHTAEQWVYLGKGVMIEFPSCGLIHYEKAENELKLICRKSE